MSQSQLSLISVVLGQDECTTDFDKYGWATYVVALLYTFYLLAKICDGHLTSCLEFIVARLGISEDVAGASFLAASSSAPELVNAIITVFVLTSDSGFGNIVGSALFNLLIIVGACVICAGRPLKLWWYPCCRDAGFYLVSLVELAVFMADGYMHWYESLVLVLSYVAYLVFFVFNERIIAKFGFEKPKELQDKEECAKEEEKAERVEAGAAQQRELHDFSSSKNPVVELDEGKLAAAIVGAMDVLPTLDALDVLPKGKDEAPTGASTAMGLVSTHSGSLKDILSGELSGKLSGKLSSGKLGGHLGLAAPAPVPEEPAEERSRCDKYEPCMRFVDCLMPDEESRWKPMFVLCCVFIGVWTFFMTDAGLRFGCVAGIPEVIMGLIIMAAGTSVPDCLASIVVAMAGEGDMAVANAVGSNTFNIFLGLGAPWLIWSLSNGAPKPVPADDLLESVLILIGCLLLYLLILWRCDWWLSRRTGFAFLGLYVATMGFILARHFLKQ